MLITLHYGIIAILFQSIFVSYTEKCAVKFILLIFCFKKKNYKHLGQN